jgi:coatomer subunit gamma
MSSISSAAIISSYHLIYVLNPSSTSTTLAQSREIIKRWANETQEAATTIKTGSSGSSSLGSYGIGGFSLGGGNTFGFGGSGGPLSPGNSQSQGFQPVNSTSYITQYHAIGLLWSLREKDRMAGVKLIQGFSKTGVMRNSMGTVMLVRWCGKVGEDDPNMRKGMQDLLESWLRHKSDMVNYEAARVLCEMKGIEASALYKPVQGEYFDHLFD